jgi:hypothetical protein
MNEWEENTEMDHVHIILVEIKCAYLTNQYNVGVGKMLINIERIKE